MALAYTTGTINQPNAGSVGQAMAEKLRDDLVAHVAWELVEEFTPVSGTVRWYVFKCLGSANGLGADFFFVMGRTLSNGELRFAICEEYNVASHTMSFFPAYPSTSTFVHDAQGRRTETYVLGINPITSASQINYYFWIPSGTSTKWWIIAAEDAVSVAFNGPSNGFLHVGAYTSLSPTPNPLPIGITGSHAGNSGSYFGITRNPTVPGATVAAYALVADRTQSYLGFRGDLRYNDRLQNNQRPVAEIGLTMYSWNNDWPTQYGFALGKLKRMRAGATPANGFAFGDAYAMGGSLWVPYQPDLALPLWDTGVASS